MVTVAMVMVPIEDSDPKMLASELTSLFIPHS